MTVKSIAEQVAEQLSVTITAGDLSIRLSGYPIGAGSMSWEDGELDVGYGCSSSAPHEDEVARRITEMVRYIEERHQGMELDGITAHFDHPSGVRLTTQ